MESPEKFTKLRNHKIRRERAMKRLENQLLTGFKTITMPDGSIGSAPLTEDDKVRIRKEIETLRTRI
jgi:hypothetical protein